MKFSVTVKVLKESRRPGEGPTPLKSQTVDFKMSTKLNLNAPTKFRFDSPVGIVPHCVHGLQVTARVNLLCIFLENLDRYLLSDLKFRQ